MTQIILPESFSAEEFLPRSLWHRVEDAMYFISLILVKTAHRDFDKMGLVRLYAPYLRKAMRARDCAAVVLALVRGGAVERFPYAVGQRSYGYRLSARYVADRHVRRPVTDPRLLARLEALRLLRKAERRDNFLPVHVALEERQRWLGIDGEAARASLARDPERKRNRYDSQGIQVAEIERVEMHFSVGRYGRVANAITSLLRELRSYLSANGKPLGHVDLACAQPALLARLIGRRGKSQPADRGTGTPTHPPTHYVERPPPSTPYVERQRFGDLVQSGEFYATLNAQLPHLTRSQTKIGFMRDVLAKRGRYPSAVEDAFQELFPEVWRFVRWVNREDHATLIRLLQREESKLVIETVCYDLVRRHPSMFLITLHDAIYTTGDGLPLVEDGFRRAFAKEGFPMSYKVEQPS